MRSLPEHGETVVFGALFLSSNSRPSLASECFEREIGAFHLRRLRNPNAKWQITDCVFSNASLPRKLLVACGGFDEEFRVREDLELGIRLMKMGVPMEYVPQAIAEQYYDKNARDLLREAERFAAADVQLARKHPDQVIQGHVRWIENERSWKSKLRRLIARFPPLEKALLAPWCAAGEMFFTIEPLRNIGVRALQIRRRLHWLRVVNLLMYS